MRPIGQGNKVKLLGRVKVSKCFSLRSMQILVELNLLN